MTEYGRRYGAGKEQYARQTLHQWRLGKTAMSGLVAKRLFDFLPPRMPIQMKFELAENVWRHFGPNSQHSYVIGPNADVSDVAHRVAARLDEVVTIYSVPENVKRRFVWLSAGDVQVQQQLLNHLRQIEKSIAINKIRMELPVLQRQVRERGDTTGRAMSAVQVHRHEIELWVDGKEKSSIREGRPAVEREAGVSGGGAGCLGAIIVAAVVGILVAVVLSL